VVRVPAVPRVEGPRAVPRVVTPRYYIQPRTVVVRPFYRPYYTFRPRVSLGFGIWAGYPVAYPYYYPDPYPYAYPYPTTGAVNVTPSPTGGLSFDISPSEGAVYIDGEYVGVVADFSARMPPLWLPAGRHYVEVHAPGFEPLTFDADVIAGQVIPFQGTMRRY
jgi:hypothetical protein